MECKSVLSLCTEPAVVAKSTIVLEVKPWDTETGKTFSVICSSDGSGSLVTCADMKEVEKLVRGIAKDGLLWGACEFYAPPKHTCTLYNFFPAKLVPVAYGIMKLQISCVIEDEKVGTDFLEDSITAFEDHVSVLATFPHLLNFPFTV